VNWSTADLLTPILSVSSGNSDTADLATVGRALPPPQLE
jgi:hypothetical protein